MALRFIQKSQSIRQAARTFATESKQTSKQYPKESFGGNAWRNSAIAIAAGFVWYRIDQHLTQSGDDKHPFTSWIEYHMNSSENNDNINTSKLIAAEAAAEYKLFAQDAQRPPIRRMRFPESFENASPRGLITGQQADLSDLKVLHD